VEVIPLDASADGAAPADDTQQASAKNEDASPPPQEASPAPDIAGIVKKFLDNRYTLWHSRDKTYRLYVGDQFATEYSPENKTFDIRSDEAGSNLDCKYTLDGKLDPQQAGQNKDCNALVNILEDYLSSS